MPAASFTNCNFSTTGRWNVLITNDIIPRTIGIKRWGSDEHCCQIDVTFHSFRNALYWFSSVIHEQFNYHNISEKGVRTIHKAKVYTSF